MGAGRDELGQPFLRVLAMHYGTGLHAVDYLAEPHTCRQLINAWTSEQTRGKVRELLPDGSITTTTALTLTNALWLNATWLTEFDEPFDQAFTTAAGNVVETPTMSVTADLHHRAGPGWQSVWIPYTGGQLGMLVLLPDEGSGRFEKVGNDLADPGTMRAMLTPGSRGSARLVLPTFDLETHVDLIKELESAGVTAPFAPGEDDFAPMNDADLFVESVHHQATVTVDQVGTEAAAATAEVISWVSFTLPPPVPVTVVVDRPFYFAITTIDDQLPLFLGQVTDPTAK